MGPPPLDTSKVTHTTLQRPAEVKKGQRESMIAIRKDYSYKYNMKPQDTAGHSHQRDALLSPIASPAINGLSSVQNKRRESFFIRSPRDLQAVKRPSKTPISILERHDYEKGPSKPKLIKINEQLKESAIKKEPEPAQSPDKSHVPTKEAEASEPNKKTTQDRLKVIVASPVVKQEPDMQLLKTPTTPLDGQNINKINNKINIIFQLNDNSKSLRKNIILHRRTPKKMVQKITIKETNNNTKLTEEQVPLDRVLSSKDTQTDQIKTSDQIIVTTSNPLCEEPTEHLFFDDDILISLQTSTISFFEFNRLGSLLKKGEADFKLVDRIPRRLHDTLIESDNKYQCLCCSDSNEMPIYVEMRAKQKTLEDPEMCPIAFLYCNVYYIDQRRAKFSSVHLDTVKSVLSDIIYTTVPGSSYFIMAWNETDPDTKGLTTGLVKYKLTPNLDLAKLASIRQFPKLNYRTKQMSCGKGWLEVHVTV